MKFFDAVLGLIILLSSHVITILLSLLLIFIIWVGVSENDNILVQIGFVVGFGLLLFVLIVIHIATYESLRQIVKDSIIGEK